MYNERDIKNAVRQLYDGGYTCVMQQGDTVYSSTERGVKPLLDLLDNGVDLRGFSAADKVVGKATAFLYVISGVMRVHAQVMSDAASTVFKKYGVSATCDTGVSEIRNRTGDGRCPMESAVWEISEPQAALEAIRVRVAELSH